MPAPRTAILADVGGTNTRVALDRDGRLDRASIRRYRNAGFRDLGAVLTAYLAETGARVDGACVAVAGPVREGVAHLTNIDWQVDGPALTAATGAGRVAVLNDLQAQGHALGRIAPDFLRPIRAAAHPAPPGAAQLVIGVGTGFNAAPVHALPGGGRLVAPSECGHVTLPVATSADLRLAEWLAARHGFAAVEEVLSGRGLAHLHEFCAAGAGQPAPGTDPAAVMEAIGRGDAVALATGRAFVRLLGAVAGDLALIHLPFGGIWLAGGVARAFAPHLGPFGFDAAFRDKGRFGAFMEDFPVAVIEDDFAALEGCAAYLEGLASAA
jgi:glucokinase